VRNAAASPRSPAGESEARIVPQEVVEDLEGRADGLSGREVEILLQAARGMSNQQIAASLHLSEATVKRHLANTYSKMGGRFPHRRDAEGAGERLDLLLRTLRELRERHEGPA